MKRMPQMALSRESKANLYDETVEEHNRLRRDNRCLRAWVRRWRNECNTHGLIVVTAAELAAAIAGKAPPCKGKRG